jgi:hypothetical protein
MMSSRLHHVWVLVVVVVALTLLVEPAIAQSTDPDYLDDAGRIIGSPSAGPDPEHPGDRGGYAQFMTLAVMTGGIGFIAWRITRHARNTAD